MTTTRRLTIIADDLTGAADTAAPFALAGLATAIVLDPEASPAAEVLVVTTNSRDLPEEAAVQATRHALHRWVTSEPGWVYRKIDSALRGHLRAEVETTMQVLGLGKALVAPALPHQGRTTINGRQHLNGAPLEETSFGALGVESNLFAIFDPDRTGRATSLPLQTVRQGPASIRRVLDSQSTGIIIADAETTTDLDNLAAAIVSSDLKLLAGTAGLARSLATTLANSSRTANLRPAPDGAILVVAGSREAATASQVDYLRANGVPVTHLTTDHLESPALMQAEIITPLTNLLAAGTSVALTTVGLQSAHHQPATIRQQLAAIVTTLHEIRPLGGLVLTGGDVAIGILQALRVTHIDLGGEVQPAIPWGVAHLPDGTPIPVATKAGSFGHEDALSACLHHLDRKLSP